MKKNLVIIGIVGVPASYGGFETLVDALLRNNFVDLVDRNIFVYASSKSYPVASRMRNYFGSKILYVPLSANGVSSIFFDVLCALRSLFFASEFLFLGVSGALAFPVLRLFGKRIVVNVDGLEWKRSKWSPFAKWVLRLLEYIAVRSANVVISDNRGISLYLEERYQIEPVQIAYGGSEPLSKKYTDFNSIYGCYFLSVCRIEPENNVEMLLEAFVHCQYNYVFVGNWNSSVYGRKLRERFSGFDNLFLIDPIYDPSTLNALRFDCVGYVHGHSAGGTNPALVEMMFYRKPIFCFDVQFNRYTTFDKAAYFNSSIELCSLVSSLGNFVGIRDPLYVIATKNYTWEAITNSYADIFKDPPLDL